MRGAASVLVLVLLAAVTSAAFPAHGRSAGDRWTPTVADDPPSSPPPGSLKFFLHESGVQQIQQIVNPMLVAFLENTTVPDIALSKLGITLNLTTIRLAKFSFGNESVALVEPDQIVVSATGMSLVTTMDWRYTDGPLIDFSGTAEDDLSEITLKLVLVLDIHLHGSGGQFFQDIANLITPLIKKAVESSVSSNVVTALSQIAAQLFATIPVKVPLLYGTEMYYGLLPSHAQRGLNGSLYPHSCIFDGHADPVVLTAFESIHLSSYQSLDVAGYFRPPISGAYTFSIAYTQRGQLDVAGLSVGSLEPHNPGMCWPQHHTATTAAIDMDAAQAYPMRLRYQSGCGGGAISVSVCSAGTPSTCTPLSALTVSTAPAREFPITVWPGALETVSYAEAYATAHPSEAPLPRVTLPDAVDGGMLGIQLDQFVLNSVGYALVQAGELTLVVTDADIPASAPFHLNTSSFQGLIPALYAAYPNDAMQLLLTLPPQPPSVRITAATGVSALLPVLCNVSVVDAAHGGALVPVMSWLLTLSANGSVGVTGGAITGQLAFLACDMQLLWSSVPVAAGPLQGLLNFIAAHLVVPQLNARLAQGFPLPVVQGVSLVNAQVRYNDGFVTIATDFEYAAAADQPVPSRAAPTHRVRVPVLNSAW